jgi:hypothetical protein
VAERIPYLELPTADKELLHAWLTEHHVDYTTVPVWAQFDFDEATGEWVIPVYEVDADGRMRLDPMRGDVLKTVVRRRELSPLPWPKRGER